MSRDLETICEKHHIKIDQARRMIVMHHELKHLIPKNKLKKIVLNFTNNESLKIVAKVAKALKITQSAVINTLCYDYLEREKAQNDKTIRS